MQMSWVLLLGGTGKEVWNHEFDATCMLLVIEWSTVFVIEQKSTLVFLQNVTIPCLAPNSSHSKPFCCWTLPHQKSVCVWSCAVCLILSTTSLVSEATSAVTTFYIFISVTNWRVLV